MLTDAALAAFLYDEESRLQRVLNKWRSTIEFK